MLSRNPRQFRIKPSLWFRYIYFDEKPHGNNLCITVTSVTYENKKSKKHQNEGVPPVRPARVEWKKRENPVKSQQRMLKETSKSFDKEFSIYLWMKINHRLRNTLIARQKKISNYVINFMFLSSKNVDILVCLICVVRSIILIN